MAPLQPDQLQRILASRDFQAVDLILAETLNVEYNESNPWVQLAAALASMLIRNGHAYLDLSTPETYLRLNQAVPIAWPNLDEWTELLEQSPACTSSNEYMPLVIDQNSRLYLHRYFEHETLIAQSITALAKTPKTEENRSFDLPTSLETGLHKNQAEAIQGALRNRFFVITGGPGTGKTTTVLRYLVARLQEAKKPEFLRIGIAAPTGKAAARLSESIISGIEKIDASPLLKALISEIPCQTIHRLLGTLPGLNTFRHDRKKPLNLDILIIDEASMIDLPLMRRLLDALPESSNLLLLGDPDQLSSVDVGSVFKDIIEAGKVEGSALAENICQLTKTYRFDESSGIYYLCNSIRAGRTQDVVETIGNNAFADLDIRLNSETNSELAEVIKFGYKHWLNILRADSIENALSKLTEHIILTALRRGKQGTVEINRAVCQRIEKHDSVAHDQEHFHGMPIIILENNYDSELYNGDLGLIWQQKDTLKAYFPTSQGTARAYSIATLPRHETAFALTIHKSQGSEFSTVSVFLSESHEAHLSKELIYTAFSRARGKLNIIGDRLSLIKGISTQVNRATGLVDKLR